MTNEITPTVAEFVGATDSGMLSIDWDGLRAAMAKNSAQMEERAAARPAGWKSLDQRMFEAIFCDAPGWREQE